MKQYKVLPAYYYQNDRGKYKFEPYTYIIINAENEADLLMKIATEHKYMLGTGNGLAWKEIKQK